MTRHCQRFSGIQQSLFKPFILPGTFQAVVKPKSISMAPLRKPCYDAPKQ